MQETLQSRESVVSAKSVVANAMLPLTPAVILGHQNDTVGSGRGEREGKRN